MTIYEKEQTIEVLKAVVKARWFYVVLILLQGLAIRYFIGSSVPLASNLLLIVVSLSVIFLNFCFWIYLRSPLEKMSSPVLIMVKVSQVVVDVLGTSLVLYLSGTISKMMIVTYFIFIAISSNLFKRTGVIMTTLSIQIIFSFLTVLEYKGIIVPVAVESQFMKFPENIGDQGFLIGNLVGFWTYTWSAAIFGIFLSELVKKREKRLRVQKDELVDKTQILTKQAEELTAAKDQIQSAFVKSDIARSAASKARDELEIANLELKKKIDELEKFYKITVGREVRMAELKSEINDLKKTITKLEKQPRKK